MRESFFAAVWCASRGIKFQDEWVRARTRLAMNCHLEKDNLMASDLLKTVIYCSLMPQTLTLSEPFRITLCYAPSFAALRPLLIWTKCNTKSTAWTLFFPSADIHFASLAMPARWSRGQILSSCSGAQFSKPNRTV